MRRSKWRWPKRIGLLVGALAALGVASVPFILPALAAYACPACYGLERVTSTLYVEAAMPEQDRATLRDTIAGAQAQVAGFYGSFEGHPTLLACATEACDHKLGGRGARATTYTTFGGSFIRAAPRGLNQTILSHEFSHVELHRRIGAWKLFWEAVPAWFDEGVAVIVSDDERYLKPGTEGAQRCTVQPDGPCRKVLSSGSLRRAKFTPCMLRPRVRCSSGWIERGRPACLPLLRRPPMANARCREAAVFRAFAKRRRDRDNPKNGS